MSKRKCHNNKIISINAIILRNYGESNSGRYRAKCKMKSENLATQLNSNIILIVCNVILREASKWLIAQWPKSMFCLPRQRLVLCRVCIPNQANHRILVYTGWQGHKTETHLLLVFHSSNREIGAQVKVCVGSKQEVRGKCILKILQFASKRTVQYLKLILQNTRSLSEYGRVTYYIFREIKIITYSRRWL